MEEEKVKISGDTSTSNISFPIRYLATSYNRLLKLYFIKSNFTISLLISFFFLFFLFTFKRKLKEDINVIPPSGLFLSDRRIPYNIPSDWRALWLSNLDELQRINDANDNNTVSNVTVQLGGTAFLHCKVRNLADRTVSDAEVRKLFRIVISLEITLIASVLR